MKRDDDAALLEKLKRKEPLTVADVWHLVRYAERKAIRDQG